MAEPTSHPIRARLVRIVEPADKRFPHDLLLYPTDQPHPEYWNTTWVNSGIYAQFIAHWDGKTCPACQTPTIQRSREEKYTGDMSNSLYSSWVSYDIFTIYRNSP